MKKYIPIIILILLLSFTLITSVIVTKEKDSGIIVLAYHHFVESTEKENYYKDNEYVMDINKFEEQLKYLKRKEYIPITSKDLIEYINNEKELPEKSVLITIDDGNISSYNLALPLLEKYEFTSINFVIGSRIVPITPKKEEGKLQFLGEDKLIEIKEKHKSMEIGSHSYNLHRTIEGNSPIHVLSEEELIEDLNKSKEFITSNVYCYPFGSYNDKMYKALEETNFDLAFTFKEVGKVNKENGKYLINRIEVPASLEINSFKLKIR